MPHAFSYSVKDPYTGADFGQSEKSDGKTVRGSYSVQLPDGRKQIVSLVKKSLDKIINNFCKFNCQNIYTIKF